jgi:hypothetical protein
MFAIVPVPDEQIFVLKFLNDLHTENLQKGLKGPLSPSQGGFSPGDKLNHFNIAHNMLLASELVLHSKDSVRRHLCVIFSFFIRP